MKDVFNQYDIQMGYYRVDNSKVPQILGEDIKRIVENLNTCLEYIRMLTKAIDDKDRYLEVLVSAADFQGALAEAVETSAFPLSSYQKKGKSRRKEKIVYLKINQQKNED